MTTFATAETKSADVNATAFVYRKCGQGAGTPVVFLHHFTGVLDDWDPRIVDGLAASRPVVVFDNRGVGGSGGDTPTSVEEMAEDAVAFMLALGLEKVDLLGFSLGGAVSQIILQRYPTLVRKAVLAGTGPAGGAGITDVGAVVQDAFVKAADTGRHPKEFLFFTQTDDGRKAATEFLARLDERAIDRDVPVGEQTIGAQLAAIHDWGKGDSGGLGDIVHPVLVVNGDDDVMVPTINSFELAHRLPNGHLSIYPDAGHGGLFQYHELFVRQTLRFLG